MKLEGIPWQRVVEGFQHDRTTLQVLVATPVVPAAKLPGLRVALGQDVQTPATQKLDCRKRDRHAMLVTTGSLARACQERHFVFIGRDDPAIGDWAAG